MARPLHLSDIPYVPTDTEILTPLVGLDSDFTKIIDLGSGDGRVLQWFKEQFVDADCIGYELDEARADQSAEDYPNITVNNSDFWDLADLTDASLVYVYWAPHLMQGFVDYFWPMVPAGAFVVSNYYQLPGVTLLAQSGQLFIYQK